MILIILIIMNMIVLNNSLKLLRSSCSNNKYALNRIRLLCINNDNIDKDKTKDIKKSIKVSKSSSTSRLLSKITNKNKTNEKVSKISSFETVRFDDGEAEKRANMEDRLLEAKQWVSKKLSDDEAAILNKAIGIEDEVMRALENDLDNKSQ